MTAQMKFRTNLNCQSCVAAVKPLLAREPRIAEWVVDTAAKEKWLTVRGESLEPAVIQRLVREAGFEAEFVASEPISTRGEAAAAAGAGASVAVASDEKPFRLATYAPLMLLAGYLVGTVALVEFRLGTFSASRAMSHFMGGFFLAFSFFKLLDLRGFASSYRMYDVIAMRVPAYAFVYPFLEVLLGVAYIAGVFPTLTNAVTLVLMSVSTVGVLQTVLSKRTIRCACLGAVFDLPMSTVTLVENGLMIAMSAMALVW